MIKALAGFDDRTAAGLMAKAALGLGYAEAVAPTNLDPKVLRSIVSEVRERLGITIQDEDPETLERIATFLDEESDRLLTPPDSRSALERLATHGELPSDLYRISIIKNVADLYAKNFPYERAVIQKTVQDPDKEQHYGADEHGPNMVSIFSRKFRTKWPAKDFQMVVAGQRDGFSLTVHQAWRLYPQYVRLVGVSSPVDLLRAFADAFPAQIEVDGKTGHFFFFADGQPKIAAVRSGRRHETITSFFTHGTRDGLKQSALVVGIDSTKYKSMYSTMFVPLDEMDDFSAQSRR